MTLFEEHKMERRARILAAARKIIAAQGYDGLTMRSLAEKSRVSVPTLYNLIGGKQAILAAGLEETFEVASSALETVVSGSCVERILVSCDASTEQLLNAPAYSRELVQAFLASSETDPLRRRFADRFVRLITAQLEDGRRTGEIADWIDPVLVAEREYAHYIQVMIQWACGDYDDASFHRYARLGLCLLLLAVVTDKARPELQRMIQAIQEEIRTNDARRTKQEN